MGRLWTLGAFLVGGCTQLVGSGAGDGSADVPGEVDASQDTHCEPDTALGHGVRDPSWHGGNFSSPRGLFRIIGALVDRQSRLYLYGYCLLPDRPESYGLIRHLADGTIDRTFGTGGFSCFEAGGGDEGWFYDAALDAPGRVNLVGVVGRSGHHEVIVARLGESGRLDADFNDGGMVRFIPTLPAGTATRGDYQGVGIVVSPDGIYVAGTDSSSLGFVTRLGLDGVVDPTFASSEGALDTTMQGWNAIAQSGDALFVAGPRRSDGAVAVRKLSVRGAIDRGFGSDGLAVALEDESAHPRRVGVMPDGAVVVVGSSQTLDFNRSRATAVRFTAAGLADTTFGTRGVYLSNHFLNPGYDFSVLALQCGGGLLMGMEYRPDARSFGGAERLDERGRPDPSFGMEGMIRGDEGSHGLGAVTVDPATGWIYLTTRSGANTDYSIYRYAP